MIALDTNILIHARRKDAEFHLLARPLLQQLAEAPQPWAIPWPCIYEFVRVITHPRVFRPPSSLDVVMEDLERLFAAPGLVLLGDGLRHSATMLRLLRAGRANGNLAFDAHIAALLLEHGVTELWTLDRDFARFPGIVARNPFAT